MPDLHSAALVAVISLVTIGLRFLPFVIFRGRKTPAFIEYLGRVLPYAIMGMLVVYCLRGTAILTAPHGIPELTAAAIVVGLHVWKKNTLLSIIAGTVCYMLLVQVMF